MDPPEQRAATAQALAEQLDRLLRQRPGRLVPFFVPIAIDAIVTQRGEVFLIELGRGFGHDGLGVLYPRAVVAARRLLNDLRREVGRLPLMEGASTIICNDKVHTRALLGHHQPESIVFDGWSLRFRRWLRGHAASFVVVKPRDGGCGEGVEVWTGQALLDAGAAVRIPERAVVQVFVRSRPLKDDSDPHLGCVRHVVIASSRGSCLNVVHLPGYWRVAPRPLSAQPDPEALIANVARDAGVEPLSEDDTRRVRTLAEAVCSELITHILGTPEAPPLRVVDLMFT